MSEASAQATRPDPSSHGMDVGWTDCDLDPSIGPSNEALVRQGITRAVLSRLPRAKPTLSPELAPHDIATRFVIPAPRIPDTATLRDLHGQGVRGIRFKISDDADLAHAQLGKILRYADRIADCEWHIELELGGGAPLSDNEWTLMRFPVAICLSGITGVVAHRTADDTELQFILTLLRIGRTWIKLSGAAVSPPDTVASGRIDTFVSSTFATRRDRMVWSSGALPTRNGAGDGTAHVANALATLRRWIADDADRETILTANPSRLYGFAAADI